MFRLDLEVLLFTETLPIKYSFQVNMFVILFSSSFNWLLWKCCSLKKKEKKPKVANFENILIACGLCDRNNYQNRIIMLSKKQMFADSFAIK